jgi:hypothetical protein
METDPSACIPCGSALGATWNPALVEKLAALVGFVGNEAEFERASIGSVIDERSLRERAGTNRHLCRTPSNP